MVSKKKIEIIAFEQERIIRRSVSFVCPVCHERSEILTTAQACALLQVTAQSIRRWVLTEKIHGFRTPGGGLRICRNSLFILIKPQTEETNTSNNILQLVKHETAKNS